MRTKKNIVYIISHVSKSYIFEWTIRHLNKEKNNYYFILLNEDYTYLEEFIESFNLPVFRFPYRNKKDFIICFWKIYRLLKKLKTDMVHAHLFEACLVGLSAAWFAGVKKRIHTRHNSTYHINYFPKAVKYDKWINYLSTDIIAISENVKNVLIKYENVPPNKIKIIYHGLDFNYISNVTTERVNNIKKKYGIPSDCRVVGVISRYIEWKGVQFIIPAFKKILEDYPSAYLIIANAEGPYESVIKDLLKLLPNNRYKEIKFETDVYALMKCFDYFIHVPIDKESEAFGLVYIEAMANKIPMIVTLSGIMTEFARHKKNAYIVNYRNSEEIYHFLNELFHNSEMARVIAENAYNDVRMRFDIEKLIIELEHLYE